MRRRCLQPHGDESEKKQKNNDNELEWSGQSERDWSVRDEMIKCKCELECLGLL